MEIPDIKLDGQTELPLATNAKALQVDYEIIFALPSFTSAIRLSIYVSGLAEKELYLPLEIDAGHWTRITKGDAHFPLDKLNHLLDLVGNEIPLLWWANSRGKGLHMIESESERQLKAERAANEKLAAENKLLRELMQGRGT